MASVESSPPTNTAGGPNTAPDTAASADVDMGTSAANVDDVKKDIVAGDDKAGADRDQSRAANDAADDNRADDDAMNSQPTNPDASDSNNNTNGDLEHSSNNNNNSTGDVSANNDNNNDAPAAEAGAGNSNDVANESTEESNENKTNLIVNYLPQQMSDEEFEKLFEKFGEMKSCKIVRNRASGYSYGFGFVDFATHEQALKAIEELNGHELETKKIKVAFARPAGQDIKQANLYIKNIPNDWTADQLRAHFEPYGNIIQVRVLGNNRGVGFVLYDLRKQAEDALEALNGKTIEGCTNPLEVKFAADKKAEKGGGPGKAGKGGAKSGDNNANDNTSANDPSGNNADSGKPVRKRERGHRGGRNQRLRMERRNQRAAQAAANNDGGGGGGGGSYFDRRQNDNRQRSQNNRFNRNNNQHNNNNSNAIYAGGPAHYGAAAGSYSNQLNGVGPIRTMQTTKINRYTPFVPVQQMMASPTVLASNQPTGGPMSQNTAMAAAAYGYPAQQSMIPYAHMMSAAQTQMAAGTQMHQMTSQATAGHLQATPMGMYSAAPSQLAHHPMAHYMMQPTATQSTINNMYSVAQNNLTNAANMQPQLGQSMRSGAGGGNSEDGVTLFVYNIGPDSDENELRSMFGPYGQVVKCNVVRKTPGGETKGFGFVTMKDRDQAAGAIAGLNGSMRNGRALQVSFKK